MDNLSRAAIWATITMVIAIVGLVVTVLNIKSKTKKDKENDQPQPGIAPPPTPQSPPDRAAIIRIVKPPAICLMVIAGLSILIDLFFLILILIIVDSDPNVKNAAIVMLPLLIAVSVIVILGAIKMKNLQSRGLAMTAAILSIILGLFPCFLLVGFSIWPLVILMKPEVKAAF